MGSMRMPTDLDLRFHKGQEFTSRGNCHVHCVVLELIPETRSYSVTYTETGKIERVSELILIEQYTQSTDADKRAAMDTLGSEIRLDGMGE
jgi:hypothetical protein